jgi:hypothetical protein
MSVRVGEHRLETSLLHDDVDLVTQQPPNMRMKLAARGDRAVGNGLIPSAAAAGRSLCAIR